MDQWVLVLLSHHWPRQLHFQNPSSQMHPSEPKSYQVGDFQEKLSYRCDLVILEELTKF